MSVVARADLKFNMKGMARIKKCITHRRPKRENRFQRQILQIFFEAVACKEEASPEPAR